MKIVKTTTPNEIPSCKIVTHPSGDQPYHLVCTTEEVVGELDLHDDVIEDTAVFFSQYDLGGGGEEEE